MNSLEAKRKVLQRDLQGYMNLIMDFHPIAMASLRTKEDEAMIVNMLLTEPNEQIMKIIEKLETFQYGYTFERVRHTMSLLHELEQMMNQTHTNLLKAHLCKEQYDGSVLYNAYYDMTRSVTAFYTELSEYSYRIQHKERVLGPSCKICA